MIDKMCNYEMDSANIVEDTEQTRFGLQTEGPAGKVNSVYTLTTLWVVV